MWKPVTIKPNDQSLCGKFVSQFDDEEDSVKILFVGETRFFARCYNKKECSFDMKISWRIWEEPKPKKLMAPAFGMDPSIDMVSVVGLFTSENHAKSVLEDDFISWPAIPNADGHYEVPE